MSNRVLDVSHLPYMPLVKNRLRKSKAWLICKRDPELGFYMINLWLWAWSEVPAGSIEDDDDVLAEAAMCSPEKWPTIKDRVLRNWERRENGRLYHYVVEELAEEAWAKTEQRRAQTEPARSERARRRLKTATNADAASVGPSVVASVEPTTETPTETPTENVSTSVAGYVEQPNSSTTSSVTGDVADSVATSVTDDKIEVEEGRRRELRLETSLRSVSRPSDAETEPIDNPVLELESANAPSVGANGSHADLQVLTAAVVAWNRLADELGLARVQRLSEGRKAKLRARLRECGGLPGWESALAKIRGSPFLRGERGEWRAGFDFLLQESSFTKVLEGFYDDHRGNGSGKPTADEIDDAIRRGLDSYHVPTEPADSGIDRDRAAGGDSGG